MNRKLAAAAAMLPGAPLERVRRLAARLTAEEAERMASRAGYRRARRRIARLRRIGVWL